VSDLQTAGSSQRILDFPVLLLFTRLLPKQLAGAQQIARKIIGLMIDFQWIFTFDQFFDKLGGVFQ